VSLDTSYTWFGSTGHFKWDFGIALLELVCGTLGAVFVVAVGAHLVRSNRMTGPAASA
jgi:hypothetical protein